MRHLLLILIATFTLYAEATFDQVQSMIDKQQYKQALLALTIIDTNHPNSSKVQYTLAQVQAGLGNLQAAREALDKAKAINPKLDFVPASQVAALTQAITPQTQLITKVESESHWFLWTLLIGSIAGATWYFRPKPAPVKPTPSAEPKPDYKPYSKPTHVDHGEFRQTYTPPRYGDNYNPHTAYSKPTEVHHHHHSDNTMSTITTAGLTAAAVSTLMNDKPSVQPDSVSSSWEELTSNSDIPSSWNEPSSSSSSWNDSSSNSSSWNDSSSSSSSSDSWSSSSDSSSSSSWNN